MSTQWDAVIGINQETLSFCLENGEFLFDYLNCPLFAIIVDPSYYHDRLLRKHPHNMHLICMDRGHAAYAKTCYGPFESVEMGYMLGPWQEMIPYEQRETEVLFTGTRADIDAMREKAYSCPERWAGELFDYLIQEGRDHPNVSTEKQVLRYFERRRMAISKEDYKTAMAISGNYAELWLRGYYREYILSMLLDAGIRITVVGQGWEKVFAKHSECLTLGSPVDFAKTAQLMSNAKIVLNVMPWFKDGLHDRIPTGMYNGAVCVTDRSSYIEEHFKDGEELLLYDLAELQMLPNRIKDLLEHPQRAVQSARNGYQKARESYTWEKLVTEKILSYL